MRIFYITLICLTLTSCFKNDIKGDSRHSWNQSVRDKVDSEVFYIASRSNKICDDFKLIEAQSLSKVEESDYIRGEEVWTYKNCKKGLELKVIYNEKIRSILRIVDITLATMDNRKIRNFSVNFRKSPYL